MNWIHYMSLQLIDRKACQEQPQSVQRRSILINQNIYIIDSEMVCGHCPPYKILYYFMLAHFKYLHC